jgi:hypothetical protein
VKSWRAINYWTKDYLLKTAGNYSVKLKPKADYVDGKSMREIEEQKTVLLKDAVELIFETNSPNLSYIRESDLLSRCNSLAADIDRPIYISNCKPLALPRTGCHEPKIWIGPANTVAQLHWDPEHNFYAQVVGSKKVIIVAPDQYAHTYPNFFSVSELRNKSFFFKNKSLLVKLQKCSDKFLQSGNKSQHNEFREYLKTKFTGIEFSLLCDFLVDINNCDVNAEAPDYIMHPKFKDTKQFEIILEAGDLLFIPYFWYHYFRSLEPSISVNWFFLPQSLSDTITKGLQLDILLSHLIP